MKPSLTLHEAGRECGQLPVGRRLPQAPHHRLPAQLAALVRQAAAVLVGAPVALVAPPPAGAPRIALARRPTVLRTASWLLT